MKYIVYLTTNLKSIINGINRIYIGVHLTEDPNIFDGYIGCGIYVDLPSTYKYPKTPMLYAVKKYGTSSFKREILYIYDTAKEAYKKEEEIVDLNFIKQAHVYNATVGGKGGNLGRVLFQFDYQGNLIRKWEYATLLYDFYGLPREKFNYAVFNKHPLLDSYWSTNESIDVTEYQTKPWGEPKVTHLYSKDGKWIKEFISRKECANFIGVDESSVVSAIKRQSLIKNLYYVSDSLVDLFIPKARKQYTLTTFYLYENYKYVGEYVGKDILNVIGEHSWNKIRDYLRGLRGWYKNFYISEYRIDEKDIPTKQFGNGMQIDVYSKYGKFIETMCSLKEVKEKYKVPASKIKNIQLGDRYYGDFIFKYHSRNNK